MGVSLKNIKENQNHKTVKVVLLIVKLGTSYIVAFKLAKSAEK